MSLINNEIVLKVSNVSKSFGENKVLKNFSLELHRAENIVVLGKSGSGKSVLIKCVVGLLQPDRGEIMLFGKDVHKLSAVEIDEMRARVGFLFQSNALYDSMTIRENLEFPLRRHKQKHDKKPTLQKVMQALKDVGLEHTLNMMPSELSGGMRKRIAIARTLILQPEIILYDEPTTGLDPATGKEIIQLMVQIREKYKTAALIISHDMNCVKMAADKVLVLYEGICYASGHYDELKYHTDPAVRQFFE